MSGNSASSDGQPSGDPSSPIVRTFEEAASDAFGSRRGPSDDFRIVAFAGSVTSQHAALKVLSGSISRLSAESGAFTCRMSLPGRPSQRQFIEAFAVSVGVKPLGIEPTYEMVRRVEERMNRRKLVWIIENSSELFTPRFTEAGIVELLKGFATAAPTVVVLFGNDGLLHIRDHAQFDRRSRVLRLDRNLELEEG